MAKAKNYGVMFAFNAQLNGNFSGTFSKAQQEFARLGKEIQNLKKVQGDVSAYQKQQQAIAATTDKLRNLEKQQALVQQQIKDARAAGESTAALEEKELKLQQQIKNANDALERQNQKLAVTGERLKSAGVDTGKLAQKDQELTEKIKELKAEQKKAEEGAQTFGEKAAAGFDVAGQALAAAGIVASLQKITEAVGESVRAAMEYETVVAGVRRTVGGSEESIAALGADFRELSTTIPISTSELGKIAETAGQLGIAQSAVGEFTQVMAQLSTTTDLTADTAATMLAQFANITGLMDYQRLGSTVAELGDATATTASKVVEMSQGLAAAASLAGMSETNILAIAASVGSLGIEAQAGSTAMSTLISTLHKAVETGKDLGDFASIANMSAAEFKTAWGKDAAGALDAFIRGLNDTERNGRSAIVILDELGITNVRQTKAILGLAKAGDLLSGTLEQANNAWNENTALQEKAGIMYATTESQVKMLQNSFNNLKIAVGEQFTPELRGLMDVGKEILGAAEMFVRENPQTVKAVVAFSTVAMGAAGAIATINAAVKAFKALDMAAAFTSLPGQIVLGAGALLGLVAASWELAEVTDKNLEAWDALTDAHQKSLDEYQSSAAAIDGEADSLLSLLDSLRTLSAQSEKTAADQAQIAELCEQLNTALPDLSLSYDAQSDSLEGLTGSLDDYINKLYEAQRQEKDVARLVELRGSIEDTKAALSTAKSNVEDFLAQRDRLAREGSDVFSVEQEIAAYRAHMAELTALLEEEEAEYTALTERVNAYSQAQSEAMDESGDFLAVLSNTEAELQLLKAAYNEAYTAAEKSIAGQYALWDKAAEVVAVSAGKINSALESQKRYWQNYTSNLQSLANRGTEIDGLSEMIAAFADGSADSVNVIAGMAKASDKELQSMVVNWRAVQEQQKNASDAIAQIAVDVPGHMKELVKAVEEGVADMAMPESAAESARKTVQAFIDQARDMTPWVQNAYSHLGQIAANALDNLPASVPVSASVPSNPSESFPRKGSKAQPGFASGTQSAPPGWAWVGEEGPELLRMRGGETVLPAEISHEFALLTAYQAQEPIAVFAPPQQSAAPVSDRAFPARMEVAEALPAVGSANDSAGMPSKVEVHIHLEGSAAPETVQTLEGYVRRGELQEAVADTMESIRTEQARRAIR